MPRLLCGSQESELRTHICYTCCQLRCPDWISLLSPLLPLLHPCSPGLRLHPSLPFHIADCTELMSFSHSILTIPCLPRSCFFHSLQHPSPSSTWSWILFIPLVSRRGFWQTLEGRELSPKVRQGAPELEALDLCMLGPTIDAMP